MPVAAYCCISCCTATCTSRPVLGAMEAVEAGRVSHVGHTQHHAGCVTQPPYTIGVQLKVSIGSFCHVHCMTKDNAMTAMAAIALALHALLQQQGLPQA